MSNLFEDNPEIIGAVFFFFFGCISLTASITTNIFCDRVEPSAAPYCWKETKLFGILPLSHGEIGQLQFAYVKESCDEDGCTSRVALQMSDDSTQYLTFYRTSWTAQHNKQADQINAYVNDHETPAFDIKAGFGAIAFSFLPFLLWFVGFAFILQVVKKKKSDWYYERFS